MSTTAEPEPPSSPTAPATTPPATVERSPLVHAIEQSLRQKMERVLRRPLIARVGRTRDEEVEDDLRAPLPLFLATLKDATRDAAPRRSARRTWSEDSDGLVHVAIDIDYADKWRDDVKEVLDTVNNTVESAVAFLTSEQAELLARAPREFLELNPRPASAELAGFRTERVGAADHVVELMVAEGPHDPRHITHIAIVPNLIPLERQLAALREVLHADPAGRLAPLRALVGLSATLAPTPEAVPPRKVGRLDEFQSACVHHALRTPHFAVIQGPPGSGKTTVITSILREVVASGGSALVVSPTHVAVDNVVVKLVPESDAAPDALSPETLPVRYAAKKKKLLTEALPYWVGPKKQWRAGRVALRVEAALRASSALARAAYDQADGEASGMAPLTAAICDEQRVLCGTPIGLLSHAPVKDAPLGAFDVLVVDEVSKMTVAEFLAIAIKARRWVLVGDPQQLPPFNHVEENAATLDEVLLPQIEVACSVAGLVERAKPHDRHALRLAVVAKSPAATAAAVRAQLASLCAPRAHVDAWELPEVATADADADDAGIVVCTKAELPDVVARLRPDRHADLGPTPDHRGTVRVLVERGVGLGRPPAGSGWALVRPADRAMARVFDTGVQAYHALPWARRAAHRLPGMGFRNGLPKLLPADDTVRALFPQIPSARARDAAAALRERIALHFAVNTVSVYDWLVGLPTAELDVAPLTELARLAEPVAPLRDAVRPHVGTLRKQYRMHSSLSRVPRSLFYFDEALIDGRPDTSADSRVHLVQVPGATSGESNLDEVDAIFAVLQRLDAAATDDTPAPSILVITPYRAQEAALHDKLADLHAEGQLLRIDPELCTLDRCQGREADYVFISLVRGRSSPFMDAPKRWNVALTRAREALTIVGDIDAYLGEARQSRQDPRRRDDPRPVTSLLARVLEAYDHQLHGPTPTPRRTA